MARTKTPKQTPLQQAVAELLRLDGERGHGSGNATAEQIMAVAVKYELPPGSVEGVYLDAVDRLADQ